MASIGGKYNENEVFNSFHRSVYISFELAFGDKFNTQKSAPDSI